MGGEGGCPRVMTCSWGNYTPTQELLEGVVGGWGGGALDIIAVFTLGSNPDSSKICLECIHVLHL